MSPIICSLGNLNNGLYVPPRIKKKPTVNDNGVCRIVKRCQKINFETTYVVMDD